MNDYGSLCGLHSLGAVAIREFMSPLRTCYTRILPDFALEAKSVRDRKLKCRFSLVLLKTSNRMDWTLSEEWFRYHDKLINDESSI